MDAVAGVISQQSLRKDQRKPKKSVKVVYISTPMKVKTSVFKFRSLVQELTGQNSDVARYMETIGGDQFVSIDDGDLKLLASESEPAAESWNDWLIQGGVEDGSWSLWRESAQLGELRSYHAV